MVVTFEELYSNFVGSAISREVLFYTSLNAVFENIPERNLNFSELSIH